MDLFKVLPNVCTGSDDSIYDTSIIEVMDIPCRNSPYYMVYTRTWIFEPSVYIEWLWDRVTSLCCHLLLQQAFSESRHLAGISIPPIPRPMAGMKDINCNCKDPK